MNRIDELVETVETTFADAAPNGWLLGWDSTRHFDAFSSLVSPHPCVNYTSFDYQFCNWFDVNLEGDSGGSATLTVQLSFVDKAASFHWTEYTPDKRNGAVVSQPRLSGAASLQEQVEQWLESLGYVLLSGDEQSRPVKVSTLELCEDEPTLGKCLFADSA